MSFYVKLFYLVLCKLLTLNFRKGWIYHHRCRFSLNTTVLRHFKLIVITRQTQILSSNSYQSVLLQILDNNKDNLPLSISKNSTFVLNRNCGKKVKNKNMLYLPMLCAASEHYWRPYIASLHLYDSHTNIPVVL